MKQPVKAALYMRLSQEDEKGGESNSIDTQRMITQKYALDHGFQIVGEYIDDGWSGTNFDRPGWKRLIADIEAGKVNCIITKDLARFGRNYLRMGNYLESEFPARGIRYISATEGEDTENGLSDAVPIMNIFNENLT